ncbi:MAG: hypothetical protein V4530_00965 [Pseudomonadota bacterium]
MDTNYLLKREQLSLMMADRSVGVEARHAHTALAQGYGRMLVERSFPHRPFLLVSNENDNNENPDRGRADNGRQPTSEPYARPPHADRKYPSNLV